MTTLAARNNNPLNIRAQRSGLAPWVGQLGSYKGFCVFKSAVYGFRAAAKIMHSYWNEAIDNVEEVIERWAPPAENDTQAYKIDVADRLGWPLDRIVTLTDPAVLAPLIKAMAIHESGAWLFSDADLAEGIALP